MSAFIRKIIKVEDHPNPEKPHLGVFTLSNNAVCIGVDPTEGVRRFNVGDYAVHVEPGSIIPEWLIDSGFENLRAKKGKVKAEKFSSVVSEGIMLNTTLELGYEIFIETDYGSLRVFEDDDVTSFLGIQ